MKRSIKHLIATICLLASIGITKSAFAAVQDGNLIFQTSKSSQSQAIQRATRSPYSHMGIVMMRDGKPYVFEAVATVRYTPLEKWIARGDGRHYVVKRLKNATAVLTPSAIQKLRNQAKNLQGKPYDLTFEWSDSRIYCSELVWKMYDRALSLKIGELQKLKTFNLSDPAVKAKLKERYGDRIPQDEPVISPVAMLNSSLLTTIEAH